MIETKTIDEPDVSAEARETTTAALPVYPQSTEPNTAEYKLRLYSKNASFVRADLPKLQDGFVHSCSIVAHHIHDNS